MSHLWHDREWLDQSVWRNRCTHWSRPMTNFYSLGEILYPLDSAQQERLSVLWWWVCSQDPYYQLDFSTNKLWSCPVHSRHDDAYQYYKSDFDRQLTETSLENELLVVCRFYLLSRQSQVNYLVHELTNILTTNAWLGTILYIPSVMRGQILLSWSRISDRKKQSNDWTDPSYHNVQRIKKGSNVSFAGHKY